MRTADTLSSRDVSQAMQAMQAMMWDMLQQQNELMQTAREENMRRTESMLEPFRRQQHQPGQLSYRQQLELQHERE